MKERLQQIREDAIAKIQASEDLDKLNEVKVAVLGKKGALTEVLKGMKDVAAEERPKVGQMVNETRGIIEDKIEEVRTKLAAAARESKLKAEVIDVTLPAKKNNVGHRHPNTIALEELERIFIGMGYEVVEGPEVEYDYYNFEALNIPANHPAKDEQDTFNIIGEGTNMYVNQEGKRFVNESSRRDVLAKAILEQTGSYCYVISTFQNSRMDSDYKNNYHLYLTDLIASGAVVQADTLEELAEKIGCPVDTFVETCTNFNKYVAESNDPECGRVVFPDNAALEMEGPFYACKRAPAVHHTMGGIKVNVKNQALAEDGSVIPGLFAAGEVTGGFHGSNRLGGNAISEVITTGRNAATNLLAE